MLSEFFHGRDTPFLLCCFHIVYCRSKIPADCLELSERFSCTEGDEWSPDLRPAGATYSSVLEKKHKVTQMLASKEFKGSWKGRQLVTRYISACASNMPDPRKNLKKENGQGRQKDDSEEWSGCAV